MCFVFVRKGFNSPGCHGNHLVDKLTFNLPDSTSRVGIKGMSHYKPAKPVKFLKDNAITTQ